MMKSYTKERKENKKNAKVAETPWRKWGGSALGLLSGRSLCDRVFTWVNEEVLYLFMVLLCLISSVRQPRKLGDRAFSMDLSLVKKVLD